MTLSRRWPNGLSADTGQLNSSDMAALDANQMQALDKSAAGGTLWSTVTVLPIGSITWQSGGLLISGSGSKLYTQTGGSGARIECGSGDVPVFSAPRTFVKNQNLYEAINHGTSVPTSLASMPWMPSSPTWQWQVNQLFSPQNFVDGLSPLAANAVLIVPLGRAHDGATMQSIDVAFIVNAQRSGHSLPLNYPSIIAFRSDPFLGTVEPLNTGWLPAGFPSAGSMTAYINGGVPNSIHYSCAANNVVDASRYLYWLAIADEDYAGAFSSLYVSAFVGCKVTYSVSDLRHE
jgi:hypothetical protein